MIWHDVFMAYTRVDLADVQHRVKSAWLAMYVAAICLSQQQCELT